MRPAGPLLFCLIHTPQIKADREIQMDVHKIRKVALKVGPKKIGFHLWLQVKKFLLKFENRPRKFTLHVED